MQRVCTPLAIVVVKKGMEGLSKLRAPPEWAKIKASETEPLFFACEPSDYV
ncbi:hypothetical protein [Parabacteroides leei]|uniref:hypothetical protein n=1 Tax=Parabacteroides leei TaxID=2939491 RepID=UPI001E43A2E8|nr:hypothetical protein [Parabacteroides goldsteinii]